MSKPSTSGSSDFTLDNTADRNQIRKRKAEPRRMTEAELSSFEGEYYCPTCQAVWYRKAWHVDNRKFAQLSEQPALARTCPACHKTALDLPEGIVTLTALEVLPKERKEEMLALIRNMGERSAKRDPMDRIIRITDKGGEVIVYTTENQLAQALGEEIKRAFGGDLNVDWGSRDKEIARVVWIAK